MTPHDSHHEHDHGHAHVHAPAAPAAPALDAGSIGIGTSLLAMGAGRRMAFAVGLLAVLWAVVAWALSFGPAR
jgi:hypothetical protein